MNKNATFRELFGKARKSLAYAMEGVIIDFTEQVTSRMEATEISRTGLANKLRSSTAYVTKLLRGNNNFTLESMVKVADALDSEIRVQLVPKASPEHWIELLKRTVPQNSQEAAFWSAFRNREATPEAQALGGSCFEELMSENEVITTSA